MYLQTFYYTLWLLPPHIERSLIYAIHQFVFHQARESRLWLLPCSWRFPCCRARYEVDAFHHRVYEATGTSERGLHRIFDRTGQSPDILLGFTGNAGYLFRRCNLCFGGIQVMETILASAVFRGGLSLDTRNKLLLKI